jgi:hypothetical protein
MCPDVAIEMYKVEEAASAMEEAETEEVSSSE